MIACTCITTLVLWKEEKWRRGGGGEKRGEIIQVVVYSFYIFVTICCNCANCNSLFRVSLVFINIMSTEHVSFGKWGKGRECVCVCVGYWVTTLPLRTDKMLSKISAGYVLVDFAWDFDILSLHELRGRGKYETRLNKQTYGYPEMILPQKQIHIQMYKDTNADTDTCY